MDSASNPHAILPPRLDANRPRQTFTGEEACKATVVIRNNTLTGLCRKFWCVDDMR
jgi:hypothetical protein